MRRYDVLWAFIMAALTVGLLFFISTTTAHDHMRDVCQSLEADFVDNQCVRDGRVVKVFR